MHKKFIHLNQIAIQYLCDIKYMCIQIKKDTTLSFADNQSINRNHFFRFSFKSSYFENLLFTMNKTKTSSTANADKGFGDCYFDILKNSKRLVPSTLKSYDQTGMYSLKFSKKQLKALNLVVYKDFP